MNVRPIIFAFLLFLSVQAFTQSYFQQEVNHTITVRLNDITHTLRGSESVEYINNSPDTLGFLYFHLWPNAYKDNSTAFAQQDLASGSKRFHFAREEERGYIDSLQFTAAGKVLKWESDRGNIDICRINLDTPLQPGDTMVIETPFFVKLPGSFSRMGHVNQSYQITQWFPKPAVYDKNGWNPIPYLDQGEFYSEFGSYDVSITVPGNYVVAATGNLLDADEQSWLDQKAKQSVDSAEISGNNFPPSDAVFKTLHYRVENVHDFAWFADKRYRVKKDTVTLASGRKINTWTMYFPADEKMWKNANEYVNDAVLYYSKWYGEYPYDNCSAVRGAISAGGAMEYPTITVVGDPYTISMLEDWIMHEVGHNWFYGMLGFNERRYPYLDEGINSFSEFRYWRTKVPDKKLADLFFENDRLGKLLNMNRMPYGKFYELMYLLPARMNLDQPMDLPSEEYSGMNYGGILYQKSALAFSYLLASLGEDTFNTIMQSFFEKWKYKHPDPADLRQAFEEQSTADLSWFFDRLIPTSDKIDYSIQRIKGDSMLVKNKGDIASPLAFTGIDRQKPVYRRWQKGFTGKQWIDLPPEKTQQIVLFDSVWLPEINQKNNRIRSSGLLKRTNPLNIHLLQLLEMPDRTQIGILPAAGWNYYNKLMLGVLLYSPVLPQQTWEYQIAPMIGLGNTDLVGTGNIGLNLYPNSGFLQALQFKVSFMGFGSDTVNNENFSRTRADVQLKLRKGYARSPVQNSIRLSLIGADRMNDFKRSDYRFAQYYGLVGFIHENRNTLNPFRASLDIEANKDYMKSSLELNYTHAFRYANDGFQARFFGGSFWYKKDNPDPLYAFRLSGTTGSEDYKFENLYLGRFEYPSDTGRQALLSQQFVADQGGFASFYPFALSDKWLVSLRVNMKVPRLPVYIYAGAGTYSGSGKNERRLGEKNVRSVSLPYEAGAMINLRNVIKVYFPVFASRDIREVKNFYFDNYWQTIRYTLNLDALNLFRIKEKLF
jgi:hypothetical protein